MPDPNARRDKALESIARELGNIAHEFKRANERLAQIERNTRRVRFTNQPDERPDPFDVPQQPQPGEVGKDEAGVKVPQSFVQSSNPYFQKSDDPKGIGYVGPYGDGGLPYE